MASGQNHQLLIMRHAKSDWDAQYGRDFDRPLSKRGLNNVQAMAGWLSNQGLAPDKVVSSPATRAKQTSSLLLKSMELDKKNISWDERIYEAGLGDLLKVIEDHCEGVQRLLLVGHNPGLDSLVQYLAMQQPQTTLTGKLMTTAAIAVLDYGEGNISTDDGSAALVELMRPKELL
ncbi:MAG: histidine phosphatase family protein [Gammaproteobacteria bacterium]|nr:histidine phosphatase family protein [Gammaproteobacteria bacterium]